MKRYLIATGFALALLAASSTATAAYTVKFENVVISSFKAPGPGGVVALTKNGAGTLTLARSFVNLAAGARHRLVLSRAQCGLAQDLGSDIADVYFLANGRGTSFGQTKIDEPDALNAVSMRLFRLGHELGCALVGDYTIDGSVDAADYLMIFNTKAAKGIVNLQPSGTAGTDVVDISFATLKPGGAYELVASTKPCRRAHQVSDEILGWSWGGTNSGSFLLHTSVTHDPEFEQWASSRLFRNGSQIACAATHQTFAAE